MEYNIYCDESGHLEHDRSKIMVLGALWTPKSDVVRVKNEVNSIKMRHRISPQREIKWNKVSRSELGFYADLVDYFFSIPELHFRALIVPDKTVLRHEDYQQDHNTWYYKMYFRLLKAILSPEDCYRIYIDIKDTRGGTRIAKLREVLTNSMYDFRQEIVNDIQQVRSHEVCHIQLADLLTGAIRYVNAEEAGSDAKIELIKLIKLRSRYSLLRSTLLRETKFNIFVWRGDSQHDA